VRFRRPPLLVQRKGVVYQYRRGGALIISVPRAFILVSSHMSQSSHRGGRYIGRWNHTFHFTHRARSQPTCRSHCCAMEANDVGTSSRNRHADVCAMTRTNTVHGCLALHRQRCALTVRPACISWGCVETKRYLRQ